MPFDKSMIRMMYLNWSFVHVMQSPFIGAPKNGETNGAAWRRVGQPFNYSVQNCKHAGLSVDRCVR